ncbi:MAG TPA: hypothetical protein VKZ39_03675, partial [Sphaerochaetaceae bacterium]|nr:hypothetical protein [Sphaerochaetaceae bacterium]
MSTKPGSEQQKGFLNRLADNRDELRSLYASLYGDESFARLEEMLKLKWSARPDTMINLDQQRLENPHWYQMSHMVGMMLYVDNFSE